MDGAKKDEGSSDITNTPKNILHSVSSQTAIVCEGVRVRVCVCACERARVCVFIFLMLAEECINNIFFLALSGHHFSSKVLPS